MNEAVIVSAVRTPHGRRNGQLSGWHPTELAAEVLNAVVDRAAVDPSVVEDVYLGCVSQVGAQAFNIARNAVLAAGFPESVPGTTIDRQCGSSQQALHFAVQAVMSGTADAIIAAGVESMSVVPMFSSGEPNLGDPQGDLLRARYAHRETFGEMGLISQGLSAELIANRWDLSRGELEEFALRSQELARSARDHGAFDEEIVPVTSMVRDPATGRVTTGPVVHTDEGIRNTTLDALASLAPVFLPDGRLTAGTSSQIADGASAVLVMSATAADRLGVEALARVRHLAAVGSDPVEMLTGPMPATDKLLERAGLKVDDVDLFEVNEAFASVVLAWQHETGARTDRINVNGGAIALGHPLGASGTRITATLVHEMRRRDARTGVQVMCEGGGMANAMLVELAT